MSVQQFCLRWNNHQPNFISVFSALLHNENLVDVTLAAEGSQLQAHKVVLSACSTYFETLFILNPCKHPIVILKDVRYNDLKTLVDFMYYGEVNVSQERLPHIIKTAEMLKIKGLAEMSDAASLSKSDTRTASVGGADQLSAGSLNDGESVWGGHESQQQAPQQHQQFQQQSTTQQQSQLQQQQQLHLLHHHHHVHQPTRRTPSPPTISPATRRKRLRKSSTGLEFTLRKDVQAAVTSQANYAAEDEFRQSSTAVGTASEDQAGNSMQGIATIASGGGAAGNIHMSHLDTMSTFGAGNLVTAQRMIKEGGVPTGSELEHTHQHHNPHQIQHHEEVDEQQQHIIMQKTESHEQLQQQQQTLPLDITATATVSVGGPQSGCSVQHTGVQWTTVVEPSYPRFALAQCQTLGISAGNPNTHNTNNPSNSSSNNATTQAATQQQIHQHAQHQQGPSQATGQHTNEHQTTAHQQHHHSGAGVVTHSNGAGGSGSGQSQSNASDVVNQSSVASSSGGSSRDDAGGALQHYQQQAEGSSSGATYQTAPGTPQIINNYSQSISTPTSPQCTDSKLTLQSVYSQGTTPIQSPTGGEGGSTTTTQTTQRSGGSSTSTTKRKRSVNPQGDENFIRALEAVRYGGIGFCKAARLFGVNNRTLWLEYRKRGYPISRPSIKSRVKQEPDEPPTPPVPKEEPKMETSSSPYEHIATNSGTSTPGGSQVTTSTANIQLPIVGATDGSTSIMCPPHAHSMGVMNFLDARHVEFSGATIHPTMRQRYPETTTVNVNQGTAINLQGINFNSM